MAIERNEAGWGRTRAQRRADLEVLGARVKELLEDPEAADRLRGFVFVALVQGADGLRLHQGAIGYGERGLGLLQQGCEEALGQVAASMQAAERARRESVVRGKKGGDA